MVPTSTGATVSLTKALVSVVTVLLNSFKSSPRTFIAAELCGTRVASRRSGLDTIMRIKNKRKTKGERERDREVGGRIYYSSCCLKIRQARLGATVAQLLVQ